MKETDLKRSCLRVLKKKRFPNFWHYCPQDISHSGIPDILFSVRGFLGAVELKTASGRTSPIQRFILERIRSSGARAAVCRSAGEFERFIGSFYPENGNPGLFGKKKEEVMKNE